MMISVNVSLEAALSSLNMLSVLAAFPRSTIHGLSAPAVYGYSAASDAAVRSVMVLPGTLIPASMTYTPKSSYPFTSVDGLNISIFTGVPSKVLEPKAANASVRV